MFVRDEDDDSGFHFHSKKNKKDDKDASGNTVNLRKHDEPADIDKLLQDADSTAKSEENELDVDSMQ